MKKINKILIICIMFLFSACAQSQAADVMVENSATATTSPLSTDMVVSENESTPIVLESTPTTSVEEEIVTSEEETYRIWISNLVSESLKEELLNSDMLEIASSKSKADLIFDLDYGQDIGDEFLASSTQAFALTAAFPTIMDDIDLDDLQEIWEGDYPDLYENNYLIMAEHTYQVFKKLWGRPNNDLIEVLEKDELLDTAWEDRDAFAIIPFEDISPRWKVISVDGISPIHNDFDEDDYALMADYVIGSVEDVSKKTLIKALLPESNRDPSRLTTLIMTGTTALVRYTAQRMEENGVKYPAEDIHSWLVEADLTHISNEVPFYTDCPAADPVRTEQRFCSSPDYYELLDYIDVDLVELTGNHILDWGEEPFLYTLDLYRENELPYYGGGEDLAEARQPLLMEHNGNKLYFIGCSPAGPENVWATEDSAGSNPYDSEWMQSQIDFANENGYIPIVTFQHLEVEDYLPHSSQRVDFLNAAKMGAVIVSGSQSHFPQSMTIYEDTFIHFGLGNLFFDQMYGDNPREFIDRHVFYNGEYINTELLTAMLEDYAKPRPMTDDEREMFLSDVFEVCNWELQE